MTTITRIMELEVATLDGLRRDSSQEGYRFIKRLCDEWASGTNRFSAPGEALFLATAGEEAVVAPAREHFTPLRVRTESAGDFYAARGFRRDDSDTEATHVLQFTNAA